LARYVLLGILCTTALACRDILPFTDESSIQGYQLNGAVTTPNGVPIDSVDVSLYYDYDFISDTPVDTLRVVVTKPLSFVDIAVYTSDLKFVRQLFFDYRTTGVVPRAHWNGRDMNGRIVPSGKYLVRYAVDTAIVKYSPVIIEGKVTASTDAKGLFTLTPDRFPIGDVVDLYDVSDVYIGTYSVSSSVDIELQKLTLRRVYTDVGMEKNKITTKSFIIQ
jgi:hypothetical protein